MQYRKRDTGETQHVRQKQPERWGFVTVHNVVTVTVFVPGARLVTRPEALTVAMLVSLTVQVKAG